MALWPGGPILDPCGPIALWHGGPGLDPVGPIALWHGGPGLDPGDPIALWHGGPGLDPVGPIAHTPPPTCTPGSWNHCLSPILSPPLAGGWRNTTGFSQLALAVSGLFHWIVALYSSIG